MIILKRLLLLLGFVFLLFFGIPIQIQDPARVQFDEYLRRFNKSYGNETEYGIRLQAFQASLEKIARLNARRTSNRSAIYGLTAYSDMFEHEFLSSRLQTDYPSRRLRRKPSTRRQQEPPRNEEDGGGRNEEDGRRREDPVGRGRNEGDGRGREEEAGRGKNEETGRGKNEEDARGRNEEDSRGREDERGSTEEGGRGSEVGGGRGSEEEGGRGRREAANGRRRREAGNGRRIRGAKESVGREESGPGRTRRDEGGVTRIEEGGRTGREEGGSIRRQEGGRTAREGGGRTGREETSRTGREEGGRRGREYGGTRREEVVRTGREGGGRTGREGGARTAYERRGKDGQGRLGGEGNGVGRVRRATDEDGTGGDENGLGHLGRGESGVKLVENDLGGSKIEEEDLGGSKLEEGVAEAKIAEAPSGPNLAENHLGVAKFAETDAGVGKLAPFLQKLVGLPKSVDWRKRGVVSPVNDQMSCGACWAFSTVENLESMRAIRTGQLVRLSAQQMIDCAGYQNKGCRGGDMCDLLQWLADERVGVVTEEEYPLRLADGRCREVNATGGVTVDKFVCTDLIGNEDYLLATLAYQGPVAAAINALSWQNYVGGVIQYHCSSHPLLLNHAVQIVGYELDAEVPHYIVRNSWGPGFGDGGYLYIAVGSNLCGLANEVSAVTV